MGTLLLAGFVESIDTDADRSWNRRALHLFGRTTGDAAWHQQERVDMGRGHRRGVLE
ncbi:hypothetical protein JC881_17660 [Variovorax sp. IB41]|nr:hypothetical protein [Variovorax sp. IB41]MBJ2157616.1 hypothetical protein [Variovorax sp. IB41]